MSDIILITGATGRVGSELIKLLINKEETVRAAVRNINTALTKLPPAAEMVEFDFTCPETFTTALKGINKLFLIARPGDNHSDKVAIPFIDEAIKEGVQLIVTLTAMGVEQDNSFALRVIEKYIEGSGIHYVHLRPNWFMQNFNSGPMHSDILNSGAIHLPTADAKLSFIDVRDIAAVSLAALTETHLTGCALTLTGGEALNHYEVVEMLSRASCSKISYVPLSEEDACAALAKSGVPPELIERWKNFYRLVRQGKCEPVTNNVETVLGRPAITFEQYSKDFASAWSSSHHHW